MSESLYTETVELTFTQMLCVSDALVGYALSPTSTDTRIRKVIETLEVLGYPETAASLAKLQADGHSVKA